MRPVPAEFGEVLERAAGRKLPETDPLILAFAEALALHERTWSDVMAHVQARHHYERKVGEIQRRLIAAHERLVKASDLAQWARDHDACGEELAEVRKLRRKLNAACCPCCVYGNHTEKCTCGGMDCCHPENHPT